MAIEAYVPLSDASGFRKRPIDSHGKLRCLYTKTVVAVQGDIGSTFKLGKLPPGAVRLLFPMCWNKHTAGGTGLLLDIGYSAYRYKQDQAAANDGIEAGSANGIVNDYTVVAAGTTVIDAATLKFDFYSLAGVDVVATAVGAVVPVGFTMEMLLTYLYE